MQRTLSLKGAGRPRQQLRLRRSQAPARLYRRTDSPNAREDAMSSKRGCLLVSISIVCLAARQGTVKSRRPAA
eukprot:8847342-Pyramimonas_sp.AAC.1